MRNNILSRQPRKIKFIFMGICNYLLPHVTLKPYSVKFNILIYDLSDLEKNSMEIVSGKLKSSKAHIQTHIYIYISFA